MVTLILVVMIGTQAQVRYKDKNVDKIALALQSIGGPFSENKIDNVLNRINYRIANPSSDVTSARLYNIISNISIMQGMSWSDYLVAQEENIKYPGIFEGLVDYLVTDYVSMSRENIKIMLGLSSLESKYLYEAYRENPYLFDGLTTAQIADKKSQQKAKEEFEAEEKSRIAKAKAIRKKQILSKTYDIEVHDKQVYEEVLQDQREAFIKWFNTSLNVLSFDEIKKSNVHQIRFNIIVTMTYEMSDLGIDTDYEIISVDMTNTIPLTKLPTITIPTIKIEGYDVNTKVEFFDYAVNYIKGIAKAKVKNGIVIFRGEKPSKNVQEILTKEFSSTPNGNYEIRYELGNIMKKPYVNTEIIKKNNPTFLIVTGIVALATLIIYPMVK